MIVSLVQILRFVMCVLRVYVYNLFELCKTELGVKLYAFAEKKVNFIVMSVIGIEVKSKKTDLYSKSYIPPHHIMSCPPLHFCNFWFQAQRQNWSLVTPLTLTSYNFAPFSIFCRPLTEEQNASNNHLVFAKHYLNRNHITFVLQ